jgi:hypothetical protein
MQTLYWKLHRGTMRRLAFLRRSPGRSRIFQRRLAQATAVAWQLSTGADYRFRTTEGPPQSRVARLTGSYIAEVMRVATRRPWVRLRLAEVLNLLRPRRRCSALASWPVWRGTGSPASSALAPGGAGAYGRGRRRFAASATASKLLPGRLSNEGSRTGATCCPEWRPRSILRLEVIVEVKP